MMRTNIDIRPEPEDTPAFRIFGGGAYLNLDRVHGRATVVLNLDCGEDREQTDRYAAKLIEVLTGMREAIAALPAAQYATRQEYQDEQTRQWIESRKRSEGGETGD